MIRTRAYNRHTDTAYNNRTFVRIAGREAEGDFMRTRDIVKKEGRFSIFGGGQQVRMIDKTTVPFKLQNGQLRDGSEL